MGVCKHCGGEIPAGEKRTVYCSTKCSNKRPLIREYKKAYPGVSPSTVGAIQELIVSVDLLKRGFHVFRATSPSCPCDLIAMKNDAITGEPVSYRIEVTTGSKAKTGKIYYPLHDGNNYDVMAIVTDGSIMYSFKKDIKEF